MSGRVRALKKKAKQHVKDTASAPKKVAKNWLDAHKQVAKTTMGNVEKHKQRVKRAKAAASKGVSKAKAYIHKKTAPTPKKKAANARVSRRK